MSHLDNLYKLARRAVETNNAERALSYYESILLEDPESWEATIYTTFYSALDLKLELLENAGKRMIQCIKIVMKQIKKQEPYPLYEEAIALVSNLCDRFSLMICENAERYHQAKAARNVNSNNPAKSENDRWEHIMNQVTAADIMYTLGDCIEYYFGDDKNICFKEASTAWQCAIKRHARVIPLLFGESDEKAAVRNTIAEYTEKIKKYYPAYETPKTSGCYVATAVYGSYDCPEVWTLRRYRDFTLSKTCFGRAFISVYYWLSPKLVNRFGQAKWFSKLLKSPLDRLVKHLNSSGIEDTSYQDNVR